MKLSHSFLLLLLVNTLLSANGQLVRIVNSKDKLLISYATIRSIDYKTGTYSDTNGLADLSNNFKDSIIISCIGFKTRIIKRENITNDTIYLYPQANELASVTVIPMQFSNEVEAGILSAKKALIWNSGGFGDEFAQKIIFPDSTKKYKIKTVRIGIERIEPEIPVILHIYNATPTGHPMDDLLHSRILLDKQHFNKRKKEVVLDISQENIVVSDPYCFVGIEWLPVSAKGTRLPSTGLILTQDLSVSLTCSRAFFYNKNQWATAPSLRRDVNPSNAVISVTADEYK